MKELIKLLNEGWRVKSGFESEGKKIVKLTRRPEVDEETKEMLFPIAFIIENELGEIEVVKGYSC